MKKFSVCSRKLPWPIVLGLFSEVSNAQANYGRVKNDKGYRIEDHIHVNVHILPMLTQIQCFKAPML
jgi:hypothetical protein